MSKLGTVLAISLGFGIAAALPSAAWAAPDSEAQGIFADKCVRCHAENGSGDTPVGKALGAADLRSAAVQKLTDAQIYAQIDQGKANMPPFGSGLSKPQINGLIAYVRSLAKQQESAKSKPAGKKR